MKRLLKSWVFWAFAVPVAVLPFMLTYRAESVLHSCPCGSTRLRTGTRAEFRRTSLFRIGRISEETPSLLYSIVLFDVHTHRWAVESQVSTWADGRKTVDYTGRPRRLAVVSLQCPPFVDWLSGQRDAGKISAAEILEEFERGPAYPFDQFPFGWTPTR